jgi:hypothetical protein
VFDLALTSNGDLVFEKNTAKPNPLKISFNVSNGEVMSLKFKIEDCPTIVGGDNSIKISFDIKNPLRDKRVMILSDSAAKVQAIKIRLQSALGEIAERGTIGSKLELVKHRQLYEKSTSTDAVTFVKEAIADILPDAEVRVNPSVTIDDSGYEQKLSIYIYDQGFLIFKYDLKG